VQPSSPASGTAHPFVEQLGADIVGIGLTHHGAMLHSPNENVIIEQFETMIECSAALFWRLAERAAGMRSQAELDTVDPIQGVTP
jgi:acetylornithine deacetylase/succinyl-diaminopimelate desuccinylase-like protein